MPMRRLLSLVTLLVPVVGSAQHGAGGPAPVFSAPPAARQFDFLIGQWQLTVMPRVSSLAARIHGQPRLLGTWKAWRAFDGFGIEDEIRIVDGSGNPSSLSHALRVFSAGEARWLSTTLDVYRGRFSSGSAEWKNGEMVSTSSGTNAEGKPVLTRTRFMGITPTTFRFQQDRSLDDGKTWDEGTLKIEAKRAAAVAPR